MEWTKTHATSKLAGLDPACTQSANPAWQRKNKSEYAWGISLWPSPWCRYATTPSASLNFLSTSLLRFSLPSPLPVSNHAPEGKRSLVQPRHSLYSDLADQGQGSYETGRGSRGNQTAWFQIL